MARVTHGPSKAWKLASGDLVALSEQQLVDCAKNGAFPALCNGRTPRKRGSFPFWETGVESVFVDWMVFLNRKIPSFFHWMKYTLPI